MTTGPAPSASRQFQCSQTCVFPFTTPLRSFSHPPHAVAARPGRLVCVARTRGGRLRVWIKNRRHASLSHTIVPAARVRRHAVARNHPILNHAVPNRRLFSTPSCTLLLLCSPHPCSPRCRPEHRTTEEASRPLPCAALCPLVCVRLYLAPAPLPISWLTQPCFRPPITECAIPRRPSKGPVLHHRHVLPAMSSRIHIGQVWNILIHYTVHFC